MRRILLLAAISAALHAQAPSKSDLANLTRDFRRAVERDELDKAADVAAWLDEAVQSARSAWLVRDARTRTDEVLGYLPADIEGFWVNQEPFAIKADESMQYLEEQPVLVYSLDRLAALNSGKFYRTLSGRTVRMVMAATRRVRLPGGMIPGGMSGEDVVYFYFLSAAVDLGDADESIENRPVWRGVAQIDSGEPFRRGVERTTREDENWIAQAKPDVLVLSNRKALLAEVLGRIERGASRRALPPSLPEWNEVDRDASLWGLRHYTDLSRPKPGERGFQAADLPRPDGAAVGTTVRFDSKTKRLEINYLSNGLLVTGARDTLRSEFQIDQPQTGVWRLVSNVGKRGPYPLHIAFAMLGFGAYR